MDAVCAIGHVVIAAVVADVDIVWISYSATMIAVLVLSNVISMLEI